MTNNTPDYKDNLYFDSQSKKNEQQKDLCITSEQLTKQLATESLPEYTEFYVRKKDGSIDTQTWLNRKHSSAVEWWNTFNITEVLAPVPSYEELQNMNEAVNECMAANIKLVEQNAQLKELLKEYSIENTALVSIMDWLRKSTIPEQRENCAKLFEKTQELQKRLDEVLQ